MKRLFLLFINGIGKLLKDVWQIKWFLLVIVAYILIIRKVFWNEICPVRIITGYPCPGCGMTRAAIYFILLKWKTSLMYNPSIIVWLLLAGYCFVFKYMLGRSIPYIKQLLFVAAIITCGIYAFRIVTQFGESEPLVYKQKNLINILLNKYNSYMY